MNRLMLVWYSGWTRSWLRCFLVLFSILLMVFSYLSLNAELKVTNFTSSMSSSKSTNTSSINIKQDYLQMSDSRITQEKCSTIHIAWVCAGYNSTQSLIQMLKSILYYRSNPLHFHFLTDDAAKIDLKVLFENWNLPQVNVTFYADKMWIPKVSWIPNKHYSGVYGLLKLILPEMLTKIDKVLVLDTDITVLTDISNLWNNFEKFNDNQMLGLVENQSDLYTKIFDTGVRPWPAIGNGFNTGVMLMNLKRIRDRNFYSLWMTTTQNTLKQHLQVRTADQDIINATIKENGLIVFTLDCTWNVQLSDHTKSDQCYSNGKKIEILHWNSRHKQDVKNKHVKDFKRMYRFFLEMDSNLLRRRIFGCGDETISYIYDPDM